MYEYCTCSCTSYTVKQLYLSFRTTRVNTGMSTCTQSTTCWIQRRCCQCSRSASRVATACSTCVPGPAPPLSPSCRPFCPVRWGPVDHSTDAYTDAFDSECAHSLYTSLELHPLLLLASRVSPLRRLVARPFAPPRRDYAVLPARPPPLRAARRDAPRQRSCQCALIFEDPLTYTYSTSIISDSKLKNNHVIYYCLHTYSYLYFTRSTPSIYEYVIALYSVYCSYSGFSRAIRPRAGGRAHIRGAQCLRCSRVESLLRQPLARASRTPAHTTRPPPLCHPNSQSSLCGYE